MRDVGCERCPIGAASHVDEGRACPMVPRRRPTGACVHGEGEPAAHVFYVKHGIVTLARDGRKDACSPHALRRAGAVLGLEALVERSYRDSAYALTDLTICSAPVARLTAWLETPLAARTLLDNVLRTSRADQPLRATTDGSARVRVARWLVDAGEPVVKLRRATLAGLLGMQPETLSRALSTLVRAGAVAVGRGRIEVRDLDALRTLAGDARSSRRERGVSPRPLERPIARTPASRDPRARPRSG